MSPKFIITSIIILILLALVYKFVKKLFKIFLFIVILLIVATAVSSYLLVKDVQDLKEHFFKEDNLIIITDNQTYLSAFKGNIEDLKNLQSIDTEILKTKTKDELLTDNYKIITIDIDAFKDINELKFENNTMTKQRALEILSYTSLEELVDRNDELNLEDLDDTSLSNIKAFIIAIMLKESVDEHGLSFLIEQYKKENINIYPESITFKLINIIPINYESN